MVKFKSDKVNCKIVALWRMMKMTQSACKKIVVEVFLPSLGFEVQCPVISIVVVQYFLVYSLEANKNRA